MDKSQVKNLKGSIFAIVGSSLQQQPRYSLPCMSAAASSTGPMPPAVAEEPQVQATPTVVGWQQLLNIALKQKAEGRGQPWKRNNSALKYMRHSSEDPCGVVIPAQMNGFDCALDDVLSIVKIQHDHTGSGFSFAPEVSGEREGWSPAQFITALRDDLVCKLELKTNCVQKLMCVPFDVIDRKRLHAAKQQGCPFQKGATPPLWDIVLTRGDGVRFALHPNFNDPKCGHRKLCDSLSGDGTQNAGPEKLKNWKQRHYPGSGHGWYEEGHDLVRDQHRLNHLAGKRPGATPTVVGPSNAATPTVVGLSSKQTWYGPQQLPQQSMPPPPAIFAGSAGVAAIAKMEWPAWSQVAGQQPPAPQPPQPCPPPRPATVAAPAGFALISHGWPNGQQTPQAQWPKASPGQPLPGPLLPAAAHVPPPPPPQRQPPVPLPPATRPEAAAQPVEATPAVAGLPTAAAAQSAAATLPVVGPLGMQPTTMGPTTPTLQPERLGPPLIPKIEIFMGLQVYWHETTGLYMYLANPSTGEWREWGDWREIGCPALTEAPAVAEGHSFGLVNAS